MTTAIDSRWEAMLDTLVREGRYSSREEAMAEAMRLLEFKESRLQELRATIDASIAEGGSHTSEEMLAYVDRRLEKRRQRSSAAE
ncbi:MAG TPA: type II toxin-antitoxin system ParD family antitoxin [Devosia sp.]